MLEKLSTHKCYRENVKNYVKKDEELYGKINLFFMPNGDKIVSKYNRLYGVKTGNITADVSEGDQTRGAEEFKIRNCESSTYIGSSYKYVTYENCTFPLFNGFNSGTFDGCYFQDLNMTVGLSTEERVLCDSFFCGVRLGLED